jgi:V/A-type H+-transporting ATPase subunit D
MIHPTRTNLLLLKDKARSVVNSIGILKARKQALIKEFLAATLPFLRSREDIRTSYGKALRELAISLGREGGDTIESIYRSGTDFRINVVESIWGLNIRYYFP